MKHIIVSAILTPIFVIIFGSIDIGVLTVFCIGLLKELLDLLFQKMGWKFWIIQGTGFNVRDMIMNVIGIVLGLLCLFGWVIVTTGFNIQ